MYLIDGYNLLYQTDFETRDELMAGVGDFCRRKNKRAKIVFDGYSPEDLSNEVLEIVFVGDADAELESLIKHVENPNNFVLVSSDKELIFYAQKKGVLVVRSEHFATIMKAEDSIEMPEKADEVNLSDAEVKKQLEELNNFKKI
ncbi:TPA: hypothetical protein DF272_05735 [Candidatus Falkowbacteria bacterium]|nr:hypothetical protein [Candidatus Falkowbacteria bacterium]